MNKILYHLPIPFNGKGKIEVDCKAYGECLDIAAKKNWKAWNCEPCDKCPLMENEDPMNADIGKLSIAVLKHMLAKMSA